MLTSYKRNIDLTGKLLDGCRVEEHRVEGDIEDRDGDNRHNDGNRQGPPWILDLAGDVGCRAPARVGVHHERQADCEGRTCDVPDVPRTRREGERLRRPCSEGRNDESQDQHDLSQRRYVLKLARSPHPQ